MDLLQRIDPDAGDGLIRVIGDTPAGSSAKFKYDSALGCFRLSRLLPVGMVLPFNFGSIPKTHADDGDALDVMLLMNGTRHSGLENFSRVQTNRGRTPPEESIDGLSLSLDVGAMTLRQSIWRILAVPVPHTSAPSDAVYSVAVTGV